MDCVLDLRKCVFDDEGKILSGELILKTRLICSFDFSKSSNISYPLKPIFAEEQLIDFSNQHKICIGGSVEGLIRYIAKIKIWKKEISKNLKKGWKRFFFGKGLIDNKEVNFSFASKSMYNNEDTRNFFNEKKAKYNIHNSKVIEVKSAEETELLLTFRIKEE